MKSSKYFLLAILLLLFACRSQKELNSNHNGRYQYQLLKGEVLDRTLIQCRLFNAESNVPLSINGAVKIGDSIMTRTNASGNFNFYVKPGRYRITGTGVPYRPLTTKAIRLSAGDTLKLKCSLNLSQVLLIKISLPPLPRV